jgi:hypothetical protein
MPIELEHLCQLRADAQVDNHRLRDAQDVNSTLGWDKVNTSDIYMARRYGN